MDIHTKNRIKYTVAGALIFSIVGFLLPYTYYRYFDSTQYYTVVQPIPVDSTYYKPCDDTILTITRTATTDLTGNVETNLRLKQNDNTVFIVPRATFKRQTAIKKGDHITISVPYRLPCDLADGLYYWQLTLTYKVKGFVHQYVAVSDTFHVNKNGVDPDIINATKSASLTPRRDPSFRIVTPKPTPTPTQSANTPQNVNVTVNNGTLESSPTPTPTPTQASTPTPTQGAIVCIPIVGCIL